MKTEDVLRIDCMTEQGKKKLNRFLWNIKPLAKRLNKAGYTKEDIIPIEMIEEAIHGLCIRYGYRNQGVSWYYEEDKFVFYSICVIKKYKDNDMTRSDWLGDAYGKTMWEVLAKYLVKIYADILKSKEDK